MSEGGSVSGFGKDSPPGGRPIPRINVPDDPDNRVDPKGKLRQEMERHVKLLPRVGGSNEDLRRGEREKFIGILEKHFGGGQKEGDEWGTTVQSEADFEKWVKELKEELETLRDVVDQHESKERRLAEALGDLGLQWVWEVVDDPSDL